MERNEIAALAVQYEGDWTKIHDALERGEKPAETAVTEPCITILDEAYPDCLRQLEYPPYVLFCWGDLTLLKKPMVTVVGSRQITMEGAAATEKISTILSRKYVIVSGLAKGADGISHRTAIACRGRTIGVCGQGLDTIYPRENADLYKEMGRHHLLLSEYPRHTRIARSHFPWRNRILAALGKFTVVTEARVKSGTMHTVNEALKLGKDIYCVPYGFSSTYGEGCNQLIQEGASVLYNEDCVIELLE